PPRGYAALPGVHLRPLSRLGHDGHRAELPPRRPRLVRGQHARGTRDGAALVPLLPRGGRGSLTLAALRRHPLRAGADPGAGPGGLRRHPRDHRRPYPALTAPASRGAWRLYDEAAGPLRTGADCFVVARL